MSYKLLVLAASLLLEVHQLYRWSGRRSRKLAMLKTILKLQPTTPTELAQKLVKEGLTEIIALCKGTITAGQPTSAILDPRQKILFSKLYSSGKILKTANRGLLRTKQPSHLRISDGITHINLYETHRSITIPNALIPQQKKSFFQRLRDRLRAKLNVNGYHGYLNESLLMDQNIYQTFAPDPSQFSVLGIFKKQSFEICSYEPSFIAESSQKMAAVIKKEKIGDEIQRILILIAMGVTIFVLVKQLWSLYQKSKIPAQNFLENLKKIYTKSRVCSICKESLSCILSKPCLHLSVCQECWKKRSEQQCFQCREHVKESLEMYVC